MGNAIILGILIVIGFLALRSAAKHFRGEGGCCGGGSSLPPQKKKLSHVRFRKTLEIEGMHCDNCKNSVERAINAIDGAAARVSLKRNRAEVTMDREIPEETLIRAVEQAGFRMKAVKSVS